MLFRILADALIVFHFAFIAFAILGATLLLIRRIPRWFCLVHLSAAAWASYVMFSGRICPLTPLENNLRRMGGELGYAGGFIEHYITAIIYPSGLTRDIQIALGLGVLVLNVITYALVIKKWAKSPCIVAPKQLLFD